MQYDSISSVQYTIAAGRIFNHKPQICIGPEECGCIPGYTGGPTCKEPLCVQQCHNDGYCAAPDMCNCASGWFGPNCSVPVCPQTCGNGGNCTAPGVCSCPSEWSSGLNELGDCRVPMCDVECLNGGWCVAPGTCACPPQWTGYDCAMPVCTQVGGGINKDCIVRDV